MKRSVRLNCHGMLLPNLFMPLGTGRILSKESMAQQLNARETSLLQAFRRLPPDAASEIAALAERLAALRPITRIDWPDSWSDEDLKEFTAASVRRLDAEEPEEPRCSPVMSSLARFRAPWKQRSGRWS